MPFDRELPPPMTRVAHRVGLALSESGAFVALASGFPRSQVTASAEWRLPQPASEEWTKEFTDLLEELRRLAPGAPVCIALMRPLAAVKTLRLPPVRAGALRVIATQAADRYFPFSALDAVSAIALAPGIDPGDHPNTLVSAADSSVMERVLGTANETRTEVPVVCTATSGVVVALRSRARLTQGTEQVVVLFRTATESLTLRGGELRSVRSVPFVATGDLDVDTVRRGAQIRQLVGDRTHLTAPIRILGEVGGELAALLGDGLAWLPLESSETPEALAAFGATLAETRRWDLRPASHGRRARSAALRRTAVLVAVAVAAVHVGSAVHLRQVEADAHRVRTMREVLRPGVRAAERIRAASDTLDLRMEALRNVGSSRPRWVPLLARLSAAMPRDAYVRSIRSENEHLTIEGYARSASSLALRLSSDTAWDSVRFIAPLQREQTSGGEREGFTLRLSAPRYLPVLPSRAVSNSVRRGTSQGAP